jgi:hypothetical protein
MYGNDPGMPALGTLGTGDLVRALDAALVTGGTTQSITSITRSGSTATATKVAHGFRHKQRITLSGAAQTEYNGTFRISVTGANTFTFTVTGTPATPATGTILAAIAPLGWAIAFTATNQRSYRATSGVRHYFMANDNAGTTSCIVRAFQTMTAVTTGTNPYPTVAQSSTNLRWPRPDPTAYPDTGPPSGTPGTYNDSWVVVGDDKTFYLGVSVGGSGGRYWYSFGEFTSYRAVDAYNSIITGFQNTDGADATINPASMLSVLNHASQGAGAYYVSAQAVARAYNQTTLSYLVGSVNGWGGNLAYEAPWMGGSPAVGTSSPISGGIELAFYDLLEFDTVGSRYWRRGRHRGILAAYNLPDYVNNDGRVYDNIANFGDVLIVRGGYFNATAGFQWHLGDWDSPPN